MYKVLDNRMEELVAYELMSANDAPERDPMDWYYFLGSSFYLNESWVSYQIKNIEKF